MPSSVEYEIEYYTTERGNCPFVEWLNDQTRQTRQMIAARLLRIRLGNFGDCKSVGGGIWELRIDRGPGYRVYYKIKGTQIVLIFTAGTKNTQKSDIKQAQEYAFLI